MVTRSAVQMPFSVLPEGTVTFLFTDIEGSTKLLEHLKEQYATLLADQRRLLREAFAAWHGYEVDTQGDAFFVAFSRATQAVSAAVEAQQMLARHAWPENASVRVRMGIHTGEPWSDEQGYVGMDVHRAARIGHVAHGGQVLLSETTTALVREDLPPGVSLVDLGRHLLKDIHRPERLCQLVIQDLPAEFPPLRSIAVLPAESARLPRRVGECPFRGLAAFQEADAPFYFGREAFVDSLEHAIGRKKLVAVIVGSSGSGKSSAIFAGLLPRLRKKADQQVASFRPGSTPFHALAGALLPLLEPDLGKTDLLVETGKLAVSLAAGEVRLARVIERIRQDFPRAGHLLLIIDQFEELYTLCADARMQKAFIDELLETVTAAAKQADGSAVILLTLRADFMGQALAYRPFADALQQASLLMGPMTRKELHLAIEKPAGMQGAAFEPGLVERILDDVGEKPGTLPLLEFTLTQLWQRQSDGWLTHGDYEAMGCVEGALAAYADQVHADLEPSEQELARRALVQLVQPGEGTEDTRRIATHADLGDEAWRLIQRLADKRLVVTGRDAHGRETAEVVHEALIQKWGRFQEWMNADRAFRAWQEHLRSSLHQWQETGQDEGALLAGAPLAVAQDWLADREDEIHPNEKGYILASQEFRLRQQKERQRRRQWTFAGLSAGLVIALALAGFSFYTRQNALRQGAILLAGQAETELANGYHDRAVLLALAALEDFPYTWQAEHALGQAVTYNRVLKLYNDIDSAVTSNAWSPDGKRLATSSTSNNDVHIWDPASGETILVIDMPVGITGNKRDMALNVTWTPDGKHLLTLNGDRYTLGSQDYDLLTWDATTGELLSSIEIPNLAEPEAGDMDVSSWNYPTAMAVAIAPKGSRLATLGGDNTAIIWDKDWQEAEVVLQGHTQDVNSVAWSPDEKKVLTASLDGTAIVWEANTGKILHTLAGHTGWVRLALWSPDGSQVATGGEDGMLLIWNAMDGSLARTIETNAGAVSSFVWSPSGVRLVTGHADGSVRFWEAASGKLLETLRGHLDMITDLKWSPEDERLVSSDGSGYVRLWNAASTTAWRQYPAESLGGTRGAGGFWLSDGHSMVVGESDCMTGTGARSFGILDVQANQLHKLNLMDVLDHYCEVAFISPDDRLILYYGWKSAMDVSDLKAAYVLDAKTGEILRTFTPGEGELIRSIAWSPDGSQVAAGLYSGKIMIWDYPSGIKKDISLHCTEGYLSAWVEWSPDGSKFAAACDDWSALVWDAHTWELLYRLEHDPPAYNGLAAWSPDGKYLLTGSGEIEQGAKDTTARIWDMETGKQVMVFRGHSLEVRWGSWSPDGKRIVTSGGDGTVRVWEANNGNEILTLSSLPGATVWSPDGQHLAASSKALTIWRVWQSSEELLDYAHECCLTRQLTDAELKQFGLKK